MRKLSVTWRPNLGAGQQGVAHRAAARAPDQVGLVEQVPAGGGVVVGGDRHGPGGGIDRAGEHVLVELVVVGVAQVVAQLQPRGELVLEVGVEGVHRRFHRAGVGIAEEGGRIDIHRPATQRRHAAVGHALVVEALVRQLQAGGLADVGTEGRVDAVALEGEAVAVALGILVDRVQAQAAVGLAEADAVIDGAALARLRAELQRGGVMVVAVGLAGDAVDHAAAAAAAEHQRVGALQRLGALHVVDVADVLHVVADAVDEEVGGGTDAAQHWRVAVAFALRGADAGHVAEGVGQAGHRLGRRPACR
ncbi:hypothetical protein MASR1M8_27580 [Thermomonas brevis]